VAVGVAGQRAERISLRAVIVAASVELLVTRKVKTTLRRSRAPRSGHRS